MIILIYAGEIICFAIEKTAGIERALFLRVTARGRGVPAASARANIHRTAQRLYNAYTPQLYMYMCIKSLH